MMWRAEALTEGIKNLPQWITRGDVVHCGRCGVMPMVNGRMSCVYQPISA